MFPRSDTYKPSKNYHMHPFSHTSQDNKAEAPNKEKTYLSNILVPHPANLLNIRRALRHILQRIARKLQLILLVL